MFIRWNNSAYDAFQPHRPSIRPARGGVWRVEVHQEGGVLVKEIDSRPRLVRLGQNACHLGWLHAVLGRYATFFSSRLSLVFWLASAENAGSNPMRQKHRFPNRSVLETSSMTVW